MHVLYLEYKSSTYDITDVMKMLGSGENHRNKTLKKKVKKEGVGSVKKLTDIYEIVSIFSSHGLKASANYVRGLQSFFQARYNEAK